MGHGEHQPPPYPLFMILILEPGRGEVLPSVRDRTWARSLLLGFNFITFAFSTDSWVLILSKERDHGTRSGVRITPTMVEKV